MGESQPQEVGGGLQVEGEGGVPVEVFMLTAGVPAVLGTKRLSSNADMMREAIERGWGVAK